MEFQVAIVIGAKVSYKQWSWSELMTTLHELFPKVKQLVLEP